MNWSKFSFWASSSSAFELINKLLCFDVYKPIPPYKPVSISEANKILGPVGGQYKIRNNGNARDTLLQGNVDVVPDFTISGSQMVTPSKIAPVKKGKKRWQKKKHLKLAFFWSVLRKV